MLKIIVPSLVISLLLFSCLSAKHRKKDTLKNGIYAEITTEKGVIIAKLEYEKVPVTVANFIGLAQGIIPNDLKKLGEPYYDGLKFYKVFKDFMLMTGCPQNDGRGQPGYYFRDEFHPDLKHDSPGVLSMLSNGPNSNGSQFIITMRPSVVLDNKNPVFGIVVKGMELVNAVQQNETILKIEILKIGKKANLFDPLKVFEKNGFKNIMKK